MEKNIKSKKESTKGNTQENTQIIADCRLAS